VKKIDEFLKGVRSVAITGHIRPDGDCVGSTLALYNYLIDNHKEIKTVVYLQEPGPEFSFLRGINEIKQDADDTVYDVFFVLDCGSVDRFEPFAKVFSNAKKTVVIDHHISKGYIADENIVYPEESSACELLYNFFDDALISKECAECIYTGIVTDTGVFRYSATTSQTMEIAGKLIDKGLDTTFIIDKVFFQKTYIQNQILGRALLESILFFNGKCIFSALRMSDLQFYGVTGRDLGGIVEQLRLTKGVEVAIFLYEIEQGLYKVSLRSVNVVDVNKIAQCFGGGGHIRAAGCQMVGNVHDIINNLSEKIALQLD